MDFKKIAEENKILEIRVGSHLFGTDTPDSDLDLIGIFMPCEEMVYGFQKCEEVDLSYVDKDDTKRNTKDAIDFKIYEYRKFIRLALQNNPNIIHHLFVNEPNIRYINDWGEALLNVRGLFPHKGAYHRFIKYAHSQQHKMLIKPQNYAALEKALDILQKEDNKDRCLIEFKDIDPFIYKGSGKHMQVGDLHLQNSIWVGSAIKKIEERLSRASNRASTFTKHGYDLKFSSNLIQLLMEGRELMETGEIQFPLSYAHHILDIKQGKYTADEILKWSEDLLEEARQAYEKTDLPENPPTRLVELFMMSQVRRYLTEKAIERVNCE